MSAHDTIQHAQIDPPSPRSTGFVFSGAAVLLAIWLRHTPSLALTALSAALAIALVAWLSPALLQPINLLWFRLSLLLGRVVTPIVMLVIFVVAFVPMGILMRMRSDPLVAKKKPQGTSYWIERDSAGQQKSSMANQF